MCVYTESKLPQFTLKQPCDYKAYISFITDHCDPDTNYIIRITSFQRWIREVHYVESLSESAYKSMVTAKKMEKKLVFCV